MTMNDNDLPPLALTPTGRYRHYKGGLYEVLGTVRHSETLESLTLYQALYGEKGLWVRPTSMFNDTVTIDGVSQPRFARVESSAPPPEYPG
ncbi:MAG: hypothetical protein RLZZ591_2510 [Pseudomonadota bacterium]|jgi:hypothetical protein